MNKFQYFTFIAFLLLSYQILVAQSTITIQPYLQDALPNSIYILWETNEDEESIVEWGLTEQFGNQTTGIAYPSNNGAEMIHEVHLENLARFTKYYYRVRTGTTVSEVFNFKTPPFASDQEAFRIVAMSDMQRDGAFPNKFQEIVEDGVLQYLEEQFDSSLIDNLALVMIPGDLVQNGNIFSQWKNHFFQPAEKLFSHVPVYPVPGNHENNAAYFFTYFKMPTNGTTGFEEHWWHKDYGNVRIIGMDSNSPFDGQEQLDWLANTLDATCEVASIDFVFAQLHHPHKSELWTPGESNFTGEVIHLLEQFSSNCNKPSIHFFGHTHAYSRGQSRDHKHLWINVATAGGAIDNWGEFPNFDYDEFSVSQDDYGFVLVEITDDMDPQLVIKRISRGDQDVTIDNSITDSLTIRLHPTLVNKPAVISPIDQEVTPECVTLKADTFSSPNSWASHGQSHWQVDILSGDFSAPVAESWKNFENWYFDIDTQEDDDLTDETILGLEEFTSYQWRVRYRDKEMNWSNWSAPATFTTSISIAPPNLLVNPGAEDNLSNWTIVEGVVESLESNACNGVPAYAGERYFAVGGLCEHSQVARASQNIDVSIYADSIDTGNFMSTFGGYLSNYSGSDQPEMKLFFFDANNNNIGESNTLTTLNNNWTMLSTQEVIPSQTRIIRVELKGTRNAGTDNDSYFDALFLNVGANDGCNPITSSTKAPFTLQKELKIFPNPASEQAHISMPELEKDSIDLTIIDLKGNKITPIYQTNGQHITIETNHLAAGSYFIRLQNKQAFLGFGKLMIIKD